MIYYEDNIKKLIKKGRLPKKQFELFHHAFQALDITKDLNLFDIKKIKGSYKHNYLRLRKGKYRAIFYIEDNDFFVINIEKREEVYKSWE